MGSGSSKSTSINDIASEFVAKSVTNVTNKNATTTVGSQSIKAICDEKVSTNASNLCSAENSEMARLIMADTSIPLAERVALSKSYRAAVCDTCMISDITQDLGIAISANDIQNNTVATEIQSQIISDLDKKLKNANNGTLGGQAQATALTKVKNLVTLNFDTNVVNDTLRTFSFDQNIDLRNMKATNISQKIVSNAVASNLVSNSLKNSAELKNAVKEVIDAENKNTGVVQGVADSAASVANNAIDTAGKSIDNAVGTAGDAVGKVVDTAGSTVGKAVDTAGKIAETGIGAVESVATTWLYAMLIIAVIGILVVVYFKLYCMIPILAPMCVVQKAVE